MQFFGAEMWHCLAGLWRYPANFHKCRTFWLHPEHDTISWITPKSWWICHRCNRFCYEAIADCNSLDKDVRDIQVLAVFKRRLKLELSWIFTTVLTVYILLNSNILLFFNFIFVFSLWCIHRYIILCGKKEYIIVCSIIVLTEDLENHLQAKEHPS